MPDLLCFRGLLIRLVTGSSWETVEALMEYKVSDTALRARRDEWIAASVFADRAGYVRITGLHLSFVAIDDIELFALDRSYDYPVVRQRLAGYGLTKLELQNEARNRQPGHRAGSPSGCAGSSKRSTPGVQTTVNSDEHPTET